MPLLLSPGQGSQSAGMLAPWLELPGASDTVQRWSERTGLDLVELVMALEEEFDISVPEEELEGIETVGQAFDLVAGKL